MTWFKPTLIISRLLIMKSGGAIYDEAFHHGLNVIRGKNSSGKTTIARAIVYSLGAEIKDWTTELLCDFVIVEVIINDQCVTLRRPISDERSSHMEIFWGKYDEARDTSTATWEKYPYSTYKNKSGFSKVLFQALGLPEVKGYQESNLTMHQMLRLMYGDQSSPANRILGTEDFDSTITREAIGDLLCGIYSDDLFNSRVELGKTDKELNACISQIKSLYQFLGTQSSDIKSVDIDSEVKNSELRLEELQIIIENKKEEGYLQDDDPKNIEIKKKLKFTKNKIYSSSERVNALDFDISDSEFFVSALSDKLKCLDDSISIAGVINSFSYKNCPACFTDLSIIERTSSQCGLCGSNLHAESSEINLHKIRNELALQLMESNSLLEVKNEERSTLNNEMNFLKKDLRVLERDYRDVATDIATEHQKVLQKCYREVGYLERSIEDLMRSKEIIEQIKNITDERDRLYSKAGELRNFIDSKKLELEVKRVKIAAEISAETVKILHQDLDRQDQFSSAEHVNFDFGSNSLSVNNETTFSESSTVFLKNAFLLAILAASAKDKLLRFPRFLLLDGIENGGMEQERSYNLQRVILGLSDSLTVDHQIIITTAEIAPDIEGSAATVGDFYSRENKSLKFSKRKL